MRFALALVIVYVLSPPVLADTAITIDQTEVSIGQFAEFAKVTGFVTEAETSEGMVFEAGWVRKPGWNWRSPFGIDASPEEPAVHITYEGSAGPL